MDKLCPECAHVLYGRPKCEHAFVEGRCAKCGWDGTWSEFVDRLMAGSPAKSLVVGLPLIYAAINVTLMVAFGRSLLGPVPFELIWTLIGLGFAGSVASLLLPRFGFSWTETFIVLTVFVALSAFNLWCLFTASAAV